MSVHGRVLVVASARRFCPVCAGDGRALIRPVGAPASRIVACPHCRDHMPVLHLRPHRDQPTSERKP